MLFKANVTWRAEGVESMTYITTLWVGASDADAAAEVIRQEFAGNLKGFVVTPVVKFLKIEISPEKANLMLVSGYGS